MTMNIAVAVSETIGRGQRTIVPVQRRWHSSCLGCLKPKVPFVGPGLVITSPVCAFLVSSILSKTSKSLQNTEIQLRSERLALFYVRLQLLYLLVQITFHLVLLISFLVLSDWVVTNQSIRYFLQDKTRHPFPKKNKCYSHLILLLHPFPAVLCLISIINISSSFVPAHPSHTCTHIHTWGAAVTHAPAAVRSNKTCPVSPRWDWGFWRCECRTFCFIAGLFH